MGDTLTPGFGRRSTKLSLPVPFEDRHQEAPARSVPLRASEEQARGTVQGYQHQQCRFAQTVRSPRCFPRKADEMRLGRKH